MQPGSVLVSRGEEAPAPGQTLAAPPTPGPVAAWILLCAFCNCVGWILSAVHHLSGGGYAVAFLAGLAAVWLLRRRLFRAGFAGWTMRELRRRFSRPFPLTFLVLALLAALGGVLYPPTNYDALAYRTPRVLHWLADGRWHWIHTEFQRLNTRGTGFEWVSAPILALARTDRFLFLLNVASLLLLPGLVFSLSTRLGVRPRVAWSWMWILPLGYCFLLQGGSIGNDLFPVPFVLAALDFGLRARQSRRVSDLWLSALAAGLATGVKANNLPLLLVWGIVAASCGRLWLARPGPTLAVAAVALLSSFLPTAILNSTYSDDWKGEKAEHLAFESSNPGARLLGNLAVFSLNNLTPPIAPFAGRWNQELVAGLPQTVKAALYRAFLDGPENLRMAELQVEEGAGLGFGVCALLGAAAVAAIRASRRNRTQRLRFSLLQGLVFLALGIAFVAFAEVSSVGSGARLLSAYYPLLAMPVLLLPGHSCVVRKTWWRAAVISAAALAVLPVALSPARPLLPVLPMLNFLRHSGASGPLLSRAERVYSVYHERATGFAPALRLVPQGTTVLGLVTFDDPETALWRPFGARRIVHVCPGDSAASLRGENVRYVLVSAPKFAHLFSVPFEDWLVQLDAEVVHTITLDLRAGDPPVRWHLVKLR